MGWVMYQLGNLDRAYEQLQAAAKAPGASRDTTYYLARTLFRRGQISAARDTISRAFEREGLFVHLDEARRWQQELGVAVDGQ
jgi:hypothetical protein